MSVAWQSEYMYLTEAIVSLFPDLFQTCVGIGKIGNTDVVNPVTARGNLKTGKDTK